ncbi:hypothetical protein [Fimbriiglobus ruber]
MATVTPANWAPREEVMRASAYRKRKAF